jgi:hypothetical protein
MLGVT